MGLVFDARYIGIEDVAHLLSVSTATVRNWSRAGKLNTIEKRGRSLVFDKEEVLKLKEEIVSGDSQRLKSRRNKHAVVGNYVPSEYVRSHQYVKAAERILEIVSGSNCEIKPNIILLEVALILLHQKGHIATVSREFNNASFTELVVSSHLDLGIYETILRQLFDYDVEAISKDEVTVLRNIHRLNIPYIEGDDLLGLLHMSLSNLGQRKNNGSYYTPSKIVDSLVSKDIGFLDGIRLPRTIDPCCGSGNFLIKLFLSLRSKLLNQNMELEEAERRLREDCIFGVDIDRTAVNLTKINLALVSKTKSKDTAVDFNIDCRNTLENYGTMFDQPNMGVYDLVIGNPPWGYSFTRDEIQLLNKNFVSAQASLESFCLFIEYAIGALKDGGILSYVLPSSLLNVQIHSSTRKLLLDRTQLMNITLLGHQFSRVFSPTITITVKKNAESSHGLVTVENEGVEDTIPQRRFLENDMFIFNVLASNAEHETVAHMKSLPNTLFLKGNADFALGIVTGNNQLYVLSKPAFSAEPVLKGNDVFKYNFYSGENYLVFEPEKFQQVAPPHYYRAEEKLIYRFINESLVFSYDDKGTLSLNSANIVIPRLDGHSMRYVLAVLNSRAAQLFHTLSFSSVKVLRKHIESIPIPMCSEHVQREITNLVDQLMSVQDPLTRLEIYDKIDERISDLYQLNAEHKSLIHKKFGEVKFLSR